MPAGARRARAHAGPDETGSAAPFRLYFRALCGPVRLAVIHKGFSRMSFCPSCGVEVREGKAFCYNCGAPQSQSAARRDEPPSPDLFKATVVVPPPPGAPQPRPNAAPLETSGQPGAGRGARRKFFYGKFGLGVVVLLLLVLLVLFALAVLTD